MGLIEPWEFRLICFKATGNAWVNDVVTAGRRIVRISPAYQKEGQSFALPVPWAAMQADPADLPLHAMGRLFTSRR